MKLIFWIDEDNYVTVARSESQPSRWVRVEFVDAEQGSDPLVYDVEMSQLALAGVLMLQDECIVDGSLLCRWAYHTARRLRSA